MPTTQEKAETSMKQRREADPCFPRHRGNPNSRLAFLHGDKRRDRALVLEAIMQAGQHGITCHELAEKWAKTPNQLSGRFSELSAAGLIERSGNRPTPLGSRASVWRFKG